LGKTSWFCAGLIFRENMSDGAESELVAKLVIKMAEITIELVTFISNSPIIN
jgi:hypothetical protein